MFGLMKKSTHRRIYVEQGEAYRRGIEEARYESSKLKQTLENYFDIIVPTIHTNHPAIPYNTWRLMIEIDARHLREKLPQELVQMLSQRIMERLLHFNQDFRPDIREQEKNARLLIR